MTKFKIGDRIRVREDLELGTKYGDIRLLTSMVKYLGKSDIITNITRAGNYEMDEIDFIWSGEMLEAVEGRFKLNDMVRIREDLIVGKKYGGVTLLENMSNDFGKTDKVHWVSNGGNYILRDSHYYWSGEMLEVVQNEPKTFKTWELMKLIDEDFESNEGKDFRLVKGDSGVVGCNYLIGDVYSVGSTMSGNKGLFNGIIGTFYGQESWVEVISIKYYLKDKFVEQYLNYNTKAEQFTIDDDSEFAEFKTTFTEEEIKDLEIPIDRFEMIPVEN